MHPVPFGLIAAEHAPSADEGAVGGSGNSEMETGSGLGAGGLVLEALLSKAADTLTMADITVSVNVSFAIRVLLPLLRCIFVSIHFSPWCNPLSYRGPPD